MSAFGFDRRAGAEEEDERGSMNHAVTVETQAKGKGRVRPRQKVMEAAKLLGGRVPPVIPRLTGALTWPRSPELMPMARPAVRVSDCS
jgi:hypothetical protein